MQRVALGAARAAAVAAASPWRTPLAARACCRAAPASTLAAIAALAPLPRSGEHNTADMEPATRALLEGIVNGDRMSLAKGITLIESSRLDHRRQAELLLDAVLARRAASVAEEERRRRHVHTTRPLDDVPAPPSADASGAVAPASGTAAAAAAFGATTTPTATPPTTATAVAAPAAPALKPPSVYNYVPPPAARGHDADHRHPPLADASNLPTELPAYMEGGEASSLSTLPPPTFRVGVAGPPGAGKSTLIEALGLLLVARGHRVAVVAVDPSSSRSGGSILGDKTRMVELSRHPNAYVRPSPSRGALGGVAQHTNDVVLLCEGAGYDIILVESVGLGQSEVVIDSTVDCVMLVMPPAGGDELQGVKKGIVEVSDIVVVNKADGELEAAARHSAAEYRRALQLIRWKHPVWQPRVLRASALRGTSVAEVWDTASEFATLLGRTGALTSRRAAQSCEWMWNQLAATLVAAAAGEPAVQDAAAAMKDGLTGGFITPRRAGLELTRAFVAAAAAAVHAADRAAAAGGGST